MLYQKLLNQLTLKLISRNCFYRSHQFCREVLLVTGLELEVLAQTDKIIEEIFLSKTVIKFGCINFLQSGQWKIFTLKRIWLKSKICKQHNNLLCLSCDFVCEISMLIIDHIFKKKLLLFQDHVLIELKQTGLKTTEGLVREDDPFLVVHPNYVIDS